MICIVALKHENSMYFGGDAAATSTWSLNSVRIPTAKFFEKNGFVIGVAGSARDSQIIRYKCELPKFFPGSDVDEFIFGAVIDEIRGALKQGGAVTTVNGYETIESNILIAFRGRICVLQGDFSVISSTDDYLAVGSGQDLALGAMFATQGSEPEMRVKLALAAAEAFNAGCARPFTIQKFEVAA